MTERAKSFAAAVQHSRKANRAFHELYRTETRVNMEEESFAYWSRRHLEEKWLWRDRAKSLLSDHLADLRRHPVQPRERGEWESLQLRRAAALRHPRLVRWPALLDLLADTTSLYW